MKPARAAVNPRAARIAGLSMVALHQPHLLEKLADMETVAAVKANVARMGEEGALTPCERMEISIRQSQAILARHVDPGNTEHSAEATINELLGVLDHRDLVEALQRIS